MTARLSVAASMVGLLGLAGAAVGPAEPVTPVGFELGRVVVSDPDGTIDTLEVWLAESDGQRNLGLMEVTDLGAASGMIFVFGDSADWQFYMWQTVIALSVAYFDGDGDFVGTDDMAPCTAETSSGCPRYSPGVDYRYAIELPAGDVARLGIGAGDHIDVLSPSWWQSVTS